MEMKTRIISGGGVGIFLRGHAKILGLQRYQRFAFETSERKVICKPAKAGISIDGNRCLTVPIAVFEDAGMRVGNWVAISIDTDGVTFTATEAPAPVPAKPRKTRTAVPRPPIPLKVQSDGKGRLCLKRVAKTHGWKPYQGFKIEIEDKKIVLSPTEEHPQVKMQKNTILAVGKYHIETLGLVAGDSYIKTVDDAGIITIQGL